MAGAAVRVIGQALLDKPDAQESEVATALASGVSPEDLIMLRDADNKFKLRMKELDIDLVRLNKETELAYLADTQHARVAHGSNINVFWMGVAVMLTFSVTVGGAMYGSLQLLTGGIKIMDPGVVATVSGLVGTLIGYVAANAQTVMQFFFGSSSGSQAKTDALAKAFTDAPSWKENK